MSSFLRNVIIGVVALASVLAYALDKKYKTKDMDVLTLEKKFGTLPNPTAHWKPIVRLVNQEGHGFCTAFVVDANYAITAAHCLNSEGRLSPVKIKLFDFEGNDTGVEATAAGYHSFSDLGLLTGDFSEFIPLPVAFSEEGFPQTAELYISCGFPWASKKLVCTQFVPVNTNFVAIEGRGHLIPGCSGGPVINYRTGVAVGVNYAITDHSTLINPVEGLLGIFGIE